MKVIWEASDIHQGRRIGCENAVWDWVIGYRSNSDPINRSYVLIRINDGAIEGERSPEDMANFLTQNNYLPIELVDREDDIYTN